MKHILVIGGYGGFGARLSVLLAQAGHAVTVAGRSLAKGEAFCRSHLALPLKPIALDRGGDLLPLLEAQRPWLVVDASGPFQGSDYRVAEACIAAGCHYADLADAREFVCGIVVLDEAARQAGVCVISGVSSVPALSTAVVDRLAEGLDRLTLVDVALSASNRASGSRSVTQAILSYVGQPIRLWRGGRWQQSVGWQELERLRFAVPGEKVLRRHVALCDVPDLDLLPPLYPGQPAVRFRAGSELALQNLALWLLSWPVRWSWVRGVGGMAGLGLAFQKALRPFGGDRSAMQVLVKGWAGDRAVERRWTVHADGGHGPWIPSLAVPLLVEKVAEQTIAPGARTAAGLLDLAGFERMFAPFAIKTHVEESAIAPLYLRIMGPAFGALPPAVRNMHQLIGDGGAEGEADVAAGTGPARLIARLFGLPSAGRTVPLTLWFQEEAGVETWRRTFAARSFHSRLSERHGLLVERFGPLRFEMELRPEPAGLSMHLRRWRLGPIPLPLALGPRIRGQEAEQDGRFHFDVEIALPLIGRLLHYRGWLQPVSPPAPRAARPAPASAPPPHPAPPGPARSRP